MSREIFEVLYPVDFFGMKGYSCDGWAGETKEEAVMESLLRAGVEFGEAGDRLALGEIVVRQI